MFISSKFLSILFISISIGLALLTALAFSSGPYKDLYVVHYSLAQSLNGGEIVNKSKEILVFRAQKNATSFLDSSLSIPSQVTIPAGAALKNVEIEYKSTIMRCFADTSIISENVREVLRHISSKVFYISIGIVAILYTATFILALHRQNPRIRALKKSLNILNQFDSYSNVNSTRRHSSPSGICFRTQRDSTRQKRQRKFSNPREFGQIGNQSQMSISDETSDDPQLLAEKIQQNKQVSFQLEKINDESNVEKENPKALTIDENLYQIRFPWSSKRKYFVKIEFAEPKIGLRKFCSSCCFCCSSRDASNEESRTSISFSNEEESSVIINSLRTSGAASASALNSEILRKQLHRHRLKQIRMASTFLLITVSFVLFYLPSILYSERLIKSSLIIYYLYLSTHAFNPIIYCFMNIKIRAYVFSFLKCQRRPSRKNLNQPCQTGALDR